MGTRGIENPQEHLTQPGDVRCHLSFQLEDEGESFREIEEAGTGGQ